MSGRVLCGLTLLATAALLAPGAAQGQTPADPRNQCGALDSNDAATCTDQAYGIGIQYDAADGWLAGVAGDVALTVTGGPATTITSPVTARGIWGSGIVVRTAEQGSSDSTTRTIALTVGSDSNAVAIRQSTNSLTGDFHNSGVVIHQRGGGADATTVTLGSSVTIGTSDTPMKKYGVHVLVENSGNSATHTITSAATIHSVGFGLLMDNRGSGDSAVTNTGSITTGSNAAGVPTGQLSGIRVLDWTGTRGDDRTADTATVTNSGSITVRGQQNSGIHVDQAGAGDITIRNSADVTGSAQGIFARNTEGGGAVTVTHSAGEVSGEMWEGILAWVGRWRDEGGADSPAPNSTATVRVEITGGSVKASGTHGSVAIGAINNEGGSVEVGVSQGATVTAKHNAGIYAQLSDRQNTGGRIEITQGGRSWP